MKTISAALPATSVMLSTPRSRYAHEFSLLSTSGINLTPQQSEKAASDGVTHVAKFYPSRPAWIERAAKAAGYEAIVLGYTNSSKHGGSVSETVGLAPVG